MTITIRPAHAADAASLALVGKATFLETYAGELPVADILIHCESEHAETLYAAWIATPGFGLWVAEMEAGGAVVGYAVTAPTDLPGAGPADVELKRIYTLNRFHGTGLGRALLATVTDAAVNGGAARLVLGVYRENRRAMAFYARQGFTEIGVRKFRVGEIEYDDPVLAKDL